MKEFGKADLGKVERGLRTWLSYATRVVVAGVGSSLRRDDFVGVEIVRNLRSNVSKSVYLIECETVPESFIEPISQFKPTHVLIIDAAFLNLKPGSSSLVETNKIADVPISTHVLPLSIFCKYLTETTGAKVALLVIQPKETGFGEGLSEELEKATEDLTDVLLKFLPK